MIDEVKLLDKQKTKVTVEQLQEKINHSSLKSIANITAKILKNDNYLENTLANTNADVSLTKQEIKILKLIISGKTNKEMAREIYRSTRTVEYHRNRLMGKLGVDSVVDLVKKGIAMGMA